MAAGRYDVLALDAELQRDLGWMGAFLGLLSDRAAEGVVTSLPLQSFALERQGDAEWVRSVRSLKSHHLGGQPQAEPSAGDERFLQEMAAIPGSYEVRDGVHHERLVVLEARVPSGSTT